MNEFDRLFREMRPGMEDPKSVEVYAHTDTENNRVFLFSPAAAVFALEKGLLDASMAIPCVGDPNLAGFRKVNV